MLFHVGAIIRLNEMGVLPKIRRISSVSGGSITAALLGLRWKRLKFENNVATNLDREFVQPLLTFAAHTIDRICGTIGLLTQGLLVSRALAHYYDKYLFCGATLADLPADDEGPRFVICASNLNTGSLFRFSRPYIADWRLGRMKAYDFPLARAVAASSAFPPLLSPTRVNLKQYELFGEDRPPGVDGEVDFDAVPKKLRQRAVLTDGGVYDNHGLQPVEDFETLYVSDGGMPHDLSEACYFDWYTQMARVLGVIDNQVRSLRRKALFRAPEAIPGNTTVAPRQVVYWSVGTDPREYDELGGLPCSAADVLSLSRWQTRLKNPGGPARRALVNWGYAICDLSMRQWSGHTTSAPNQFPLSGGLQH